MANKRQLKKYMKNMAANLAGETVFILNYYDGIDEAKANDVIDKIFNLLTERSTMCRLISTKHAKILSPAIARRIARRAMPTTRLPIRSCIQISLKASARC